MQSFLAKCAALGIVAGGFTLTGDVGRLVERGQRLLDAQTVPSETPPAEPPAAVAAAAAIAGDSSPSSASTAASSSRIKDLYRGITSIEKTHSSYEREKEAD